MRVNSNTATKIETFLPSAEDATPQKLETNAPLADCDIDKDFSSEH